MTRKADDARSRELEVVSELDRQIELEVFRSLMVHKRGRRFVWNFLGECRIFSSTIVFEPGGPLKSAFLEGKRALGLRYMALAQKCPNEFTLMLQENSGVTFEDNNNGRHSNTSGSSGSGSGSGSSGDSGPELDAYDPFG